jgi:Cupin superfamily protein
MTSQTGKRPCPRINEDFQEDDGAHEKSKSFSLVLQSILAGEGMTLDDFFEKIWQNRAHLFRHDSSGGRRPTETTTSGADGMWRDERMRTTPWNEIVRQGWSVLTDVLETAESEAIDYEHETPLILRNLEVLTGEETLASYGTSLFGPYLDGCSVVLNHADLLSPHIAALCEDLQKSFPHAYANSYLTPPDSQTVPPHADDRDVLVFQLVGSKDWLVHRTVPVPYPYPHEQVGKAGIPVPKEVLEGPVALSIRLGPGDVLYMPRGMVHQAHSTPTSPSFHVTVALATHDWTLAGNLGRAIQTTLFGRIDFRRSLLPTNSTSNVSTIQNDIDEALEKIRSEVSATTILKDMQGRIDRHNSRAFPRRTALIRRARLSANACRGWGRSRTKSSEDAMDDLVGPGAAKDVKYSTLIRAASAIEREHAQNALSALTSTSPANVPPPHRGLSVREEIGDSITAIVSKVKADATRSYQVDGLGQLMDVPNPLVCKLSLLSLAKRAVELGSFAVVTFEDERSVEATNK